MMPSRPTTEKYAKNKKSGKPRHAGLDSHTRPLHLARALPTATLEQGGNHAARGHEPDTLLPYAKGTTSVRHRDAAAAGMGGVSAPCAG